MRDWEYGITYRNVYEDGTVGFIFGTRIGADLEVWHLKRIGVVRVISKDR